MRVFVAGFAESANNDPDQDWDSDCEPKDESEFGLIKLALLVSSEFSQNVTGCTCLGVIADITVLRARLAVHS